MGLFDKFKKKESYELDKKKAMLQLMTKLNNSRASVIEEGVISADELDKELGL